MKKFIGRGLYGLRAACKYEPREVYEVVGRRAFSRLRSPERPRALNSESCFSRAAVKLRSGRVRLGYGFFFLRWCGR